MLLPEQRYGCSYYSETCYNWLRDTTVCLIDDDLLVFNKICSEKISIETSLMVSSSHVVAFPSRHKCYVEYQLQELYVHLLNISEYKGAAILIKIIRESIPHTDPRGVVDLKFQSLFTCVFMVVHL